MGRKRYYKKPAQFKAEEEYDSDDERAYKQFEQPDPKSRSYVYDDIDEFHAQKEKIMLEKGAKFNRDDFSDEEEVMGMDLSEEEYDAGDFQPEQSSDSEEDTYINHVNTMAWGKKKSAFYGTNYVGKDYGRINEEDVQAAAEEEEDAKALEKRLRQQLDEDDFVLETFDLDKKPLEDEIKIDINIDQLSKNEKYSLINKKYPEMLMLIEEFKLKMSEVKDIFQPLTTMIKDGTITSEKAAQYIKIKYKLYLNYCINICFYMVLRARGIQTNNHPVIKRLAAFKMLINQLEPVDKQFEDILEKILSEKSVGDNLEIMEELTNISSEAIEKIKIKNTKHVRFNEKNDKVSKTSQFITNMEKDGSIVKEESPDNSENADEQERRAINYQISKNKGLTPRRKKINRNPRVKLRFKYKKAQVRRKGQVQLPRTELIRYGGELSGIRAGVKKSIKIK